MSAVTTAGGIAAAFAGGAATMWFATHRWRGARRGSDATRTRGAGRTGDLVLAAMDDGVILLDDAGKVRYANPAAFRLVGKTHTDGDAADPTSSTYVPPTLRVLIDEARAAGGVREREIEIGRPSRTLRASAFPIENEPLAVLVLRDVTESRRVDAIRRDFVAAASHELKTPVASIQATAETLEHAIEEDTVAARRFVDNLLKDSDRLSRVVRDLLDLSRLETEDLSYEPVALDKIIREEIERVETRVRDASLSISFEANPVMVRGSSEDLALLASNLFDNAIRFTRPGGRILVRLEHSDTTASLTVSDTGVGIPSRDLPRIFERFYRVDRARSRDTGGTGLGLAIVKHVAEQHGGSVEAKSELGRGSTFQVKIPVSRDT